MHIIKNQQNVHLVEKLFQPNIQIQKSKFQDHWFIIPLTLAARIWMELENKKETNKLKYLVSHVHLQNEIDKMNSYNLIIEWYE